MGKRSEGRSRNLVRSFERKAVITGRWWQYLLPAAIALQGCMRNQNLYGGRLTAKEYFFKFLEGSLPMQPGSMEPFQIPGDWCVFCMVLLYITGKTARNFTDGFGMQVLFRTERTEKLWRAKWLCCLENIVLYFAAAYAVTGLFVVRKTGHLSIGGWEQVFLQLLLPVLAASVICIWQTVISMAFGALMGLLAMTILLVASAYFEKWYLIGNYLMKLRVEEMVADKMTGAGSAVFLLALLAAGIIAGSRVVKRMDYMHVRGDW